MAKVIKLNDKDNVCVALEDISKGTVINVDNQEIQVLDDVPLGHKIAIADINDICIKYGSEIGSVVSPVKVGSLLDEKRLKSNLENKKEWKYAPVNNKIFTDIGKKMELRGYKRFNGEYGIRNDLFVLPTVGCISQLVKYYTKDCDVTLLTHPYGCSQSGDDGENTLNALSQIITHPNVGGIVVVGLGCENTQISMIKEKVGLNPRVKYITLQDEDDERAAIMDAIQELQELVQKDERVTMDVSKLKIGVECGGSDALSGITANPLVGRLAEHMVKEENASIVITEIPEFFGAESNALNVCKNEDIYQRLNDLFIGYRKYYVDNNVEVYANPSPGNKKGGISTLEEKSLGCVNKIGNLEILDVKEYAQTITEHGVTVISSPGNDLVATTALGLSGCHLVLFTTGRGTPFGGFVPTIKISTNTKMYNKKKHWIDFNAGRLLEENPEQVLSDFYDCIEKVCNGEKTKNEINESYDIAIFKTGVTL